MSVLAEFLQPLFADGRALLREPPAPAGRPDARATAVLERAFADYRLAEAGPVIPFDKVTALAAATLVHHACWFLVNQDQPEAEVEKALTMPANPHNPSQHLSADLVLHYLPQIHRRARALDPDDTLTKRLSEIMRQWPLSGVLADVTEEPRTPLDFGGHPGLLLLYAERWSRTEKSAWMPQGHGWEFLELVWQDLGKDVAVLRQAKMSEDQPNI